MAATVVVLAMPACAVHGLSFKADRRVDITAPSDRAQVRLPVTVEWTVKQFPVGDGAGAFGVYLDRSPQPSGKTQAWLFRGDSGCKGVGAPVCAAAPYLNGHNVFRTTDRSFTVVQVARLLGNDRRRQFHEVTVVLLDAGGRRAGEGAWSVQFEVKRLS